MTWEPIKRKCVTCGKDFVAKSPAHKYCHNPCLSKSEYEHMANYFQVKYIRFLYAKFKKDFPLKAEKLKKEMLEKEGKEFTEIALDGI